MILNEGISCLALMVNQIEGKHFRALCRRIVRCLSGYVDSQQHQIGMTPCNTQNTKAAGKIWNYSIIKAYMIIHRYMLITNTTLLFLHVSSSYDREPSCECSLIPLPKARNVAAAYRGEYWIQTNILVVITQSTQALPILQQSVPTQQPLKDIYLSKSESEQLWTCFLLFSHSS